MKESGRRAETSYTVKRPNLLLAAIFGALAFASSASASNPFGITVVRFVAGTPPAQMRAAVSSAGGAVVSDLSPIGALAAVPTANGFAERIRRNPAVVAAFQDALLVNDRGNDVNQHGGGRAPDGDGQLGASLPDPWHDLPSFLGVSNPEGIAATARSWLPCSTPASIPSIASCRAWSTGAWAGTSSRATT